MTKLLVSAVIDRVKSLRYTDVIGGKGQQTPSIPTMCRSSWICFLLFLFHDAVPHSQTVVGDCMILCWLPRAETTETSYI
jgi:hypothetical protein